MPENELNHSLEPQKWVERYADEFFGFALSKVNDSDLAEDLVQETFVSALKSQERFKGNSSEKTWLYSILRNKIIDYYRSFAARMNKNSIREWTQFPEFIPDGLHKGSWDKSVKIPEWGVEDQDPVENEEFYQVLEQCIGEIPKKGQAVFKMKYFEERDAKEICKELSITSSNYWVMLHRIRLSLRKCLEKNWFKLDG